MSATLVKSAIREYAAANRPDHLDFWPSIQRQLWLTDQTLDTRAQEIIRPHQPKQIWRVWLGEYPASAKLFSRTVLARVGACALVLLSLGVTSLMLLLLASHAPVVDAAEILTRASQVTNGQIASSANDGITSFHGDYTSRHRNDPTGAFYETHQLTWFVAPDKYLLRDTERDVDGREWSSFNGTDGTLSYNYRSELNQLQLYDAKSNWGQDAQTDNSQIRLFAQSDLNTVLEHARLKTLPVDPRTKPVPPPYVYDTKVLGTENVLGRAAYVIELTMAPGGSVQLPKAQVPDRVKMWVDHQVYVVLRTQGWGTDGQLLQDSGYQTFDINQSIDAAAFNFNPPADADVVDMRLVNSVDLDKAWAQVAQQSNFSLYSVVDPALGLEPRRPTYFPSRGTVSQLYEAKATVESHPVWGVTEGIPPIPAAPNNSNGSQSTVGRSGLSTVPQLILTQGLPLSINIATLGIGRPIQITNSVSNTNPSSTGSAITGYMYNRNGMPILVFDRGETRIMLTGLLYPTKQSPNGQATLQRTEDLLIRSAEALQSLKVK